MSHVDSGPVRALGEGLPLLGAAMVSCVVALYNGFPLTYADTGNYLDNAIDLVRWHRPWFFFRPATYGAFLVPFASSRTLWLLPLAQGLLVAGVVDATLRTASIALSGRALFALFVGLCAVTSLPWFSGQIMPDVFTAVVILLSYIVVWAPADRSRVVWPAFALLSFAIATHLSHFPLAVVLLLAGLALRAATASAQRSPRLTATVMLRAGCPIAIAAILVVVPNFLLHRKLVLSRSSSVFALGHLVGEGAVQRYLDRTCPARRFLLCGEREALHPDIDWFLWSATGPWTRARDAMAHGDSTFLREAPVIVAGTLRQEWPAVLASSVGASAEQLVTFGLHPGEHSFSASVAGTMARLGPSVSDAYSASRQVRGTLPLAAAGRVQYAAVGAAVLALLWCLPRLRGPRHRPFRLLVATAVVGLVANAAVLASLSTVHPRYQGRVVWLVVLLGAVAALRLIEDRRARPAASSA